MPRHTFTRSACLLLTTLILAGCGDADDDDGVGPGGNPGGCVISEVCIGAGAGEMTGEVTGEVHEAVSGRAVFTEGADGSWVLSMGTDHAGESGIFFAGAGGRPATGTHAFDGTTAELAASYLHGESDDLYLAEEGKLIVAQSSSSRITGGFEFTAFDEQGNAVTVEGTFEALVGQDVVTIGGSFGAPNADER